MAWKLPRMRLKTRHEAAPDVPNDVLADDLHIRGPRRRPGGGILHPTQIHQQGVEPDVHGLTRVPGHGDPPPYSVPRSGYRQVLERSRLQLVNHCVLVDVRVYAARRASILGLRVELSGGGVMREENVAELGQSELVVYFAGPFHDGARLGRDLGVWAGRMRRDARGRVKAFVGGGIVPLVGIFIDESLVRERTLHRPTGEEWRLEGGRRRSPRRVRRCRDAVVAWCA